jgi:hypothetical protein
VGEITEKKFIITEIEKQQIWNLIVERKAGMVNKLLDNLPQFIDQEETIKQLKKENKGLEEEVSNLLEKVLAK